MSTLKLKDSEILDKAADILVPHGYWCKGSLKSGNAHCAIGALNMALWGSIFPAAVSSRHFSSDPNHIRLVELLGEALKFKVQPTGGQSYHYGTVENWNDKDGRKKTQVIAAFRKAARIARFREMTTDIPEDIMAEEKKANTQAPAKPLSNPRAIAIAKMEGHKRDLKVKQLLKAEAKT